MATKSALTVGFLLGLMVLVACLPATSSADPEKEWEKSKHAHRERALAEATVESRGPVTAHCGRCHSEQGFLAWLPQLFKGDPGLLKKPDGAPADPSYLAGLGLTRDKVRTQTCAVCHKEDFSLRVTDSTPMLPAGFAASGVGKGALCMTCHNTRNGRVTWNTADPARYTAPHEAAQTDVILGKNSFFLDDTVERAAAHAVFTGNACVTCHKVLGKEGHTFQPAQNTCANCHGPAMVKDSVQEPTRHLLKRLKDAVERRVLAVKGRIGMVTAWDPATDKEAEKVAIDGNQIQGVDILSIHGQLAFKFAMADGRAVYSQVGNIKVNVGGQPGWLIFETSDPVVRAGWNYLLIEYDGSFGVHNPRFARELLLATINALR